MKSKLPQGYLIKEIPDAEFFPLFEKHGARVFSDNLDYELEDVDSKAEIQQSRKLSEEYSKPSHYRINLGLFYKNKFVGWSWGYQYTSQVFYMCNSAVLPAHRRKGLYTILMKEVVERASAKGFKTIFSRHIMTNNEILIPKLKMGFKITNFELSERFGALIHLTYFPQKIRRDILDFRSGLKRPDKKMKKIFKL